MSCHIVLGNPGTYHPGDTVHGKVVCDFSSTQNFRGIRVKFRGREHTAWTERESYYDSSSKQTKYRTVHYSGDNKFLSVNVTLVGESSLPRGHYEYPFSFTFPRFNIPNPYNGNYGYIRYYIKATVDIPFAFDYDDEITLHLIAPINFNDIINRLQLNPVSYQDEKMLCCCCCASDPITMDLMLTKEAFVVGEVANIKIEVTNMSNTSLDEMILSLQMEIESKSTSPSTHHKYDKELIAVSSDTGVGAHGQRTYKFNFQIPANTIVPNFQGCELFKQWCTLTAEAVIPGCHSNLEIETGIVLGHIPITESRVTMIPAAQAPGGPFGPPPPLPPVYTDDVPPYPVGEGQIGFVVPSKGMPMPAPVHGGPSSNNASAPLEEGGPSAPTKAQMAGEEDFEVLDGDGHNEPPPPAYQDSMKDTLSPSAPPK